MPKTKEPTGLALIGGIFSASSCEPAVSEPFGENTFGLYMLPGFEPGGGRQ